MKQERNYNSIFSYAFVGALLFVASFAYVAVYYSNIVKFQLPYTTIASTLIVSAVAMLYKAVKNDRNRLEQV